MRIINQTPSVQYKKILLKDLECGRFFVDELESPCLCIKLNRSNLPDIYTDCYIVCVDNGYVFTKNGYDYVYAVDGEINYHLEVER